MSWENDLIECIRITIGDIESDTYTDDRLIKLAVLAANYVLIDCEFDNNYSVNINNQTIIPDPTQTNPIDNSFIALVALKAAWILLGSEMKLNAQNGGLVIKDGPSSIDTRAIFTNSMAYHKQLEKDYAFMKMNYKLVNSAKNAGIIATPTTVINIFTSIETLSY